MRVTALEKLLAATQPQMLLWKLLNNVIMLPSYVFLGQASVKLPDLETLCSGMLSTSDDSDVEDFF